MPTPDRRPARKYPRVARINQVLREVIAEELERLSDTDPRLRLVTVTHVHADADMSRATVLFSSLTDEAREALEEDRVRLQGAVGRQVRMKRTPLLSFDEDPAIRSGQRVDEILRHLEQDDRN